MARSPRLSAFAMHSLFRETAEDSPVEKSESESEGSDDSHAENTAGRKRKISIEEEEPIFNVKQKKRKIKRKSSASTDFQNESNVNIGFSPASSSSPKFNTSHSGNEAADEAFRWLMNPTNSHKFFNQRFEKYPLHVKRNSNYYKGLFSTQAFDKIMRENDLSYDIQIDVLQYVDGTRRPVKDDVKVTPAFVWKKYNEGNSVRMRNPQVYHKQLRHLCSLLQEYFSSDVGANMYLTPAGTQGFPPHYDDIDAFVLQIEGKKLWKIYRPRNENEVLSRISSGDLTEDEIGEPCMEVELNAGDLLYFPRGFIHQAKAAPDVYSLHLTISTNHLNTYGDLIQAGLQNALEQAMQNDVEFRHSVPKEYLNLVGATYADNNCQAREVFENKVTKLATKVLSYFSVDFAADMLAVEFLHASLPPIFSKKEKACSSHGNGARFENGRAVVTAKFTLQTKIRFIRKRSFR
ncbi:ribosomal oxygenase 1 [Trichonephila clavata]|uniref:Bifunctional lysine-specific demethylase and histidyl-hydroxylase n=1 Tax=Trichonephila clavata TaxID=2740835 RepID=A0A8X6IBS4_TRICU|nr:ribosomal oxygenase 1 [Trichonephila clavata]